MNNTRRSILVLVVSLLVGCFGKVQIVPAASAPKPPSGNGWYCAEAAFPPRGSDTQYSHSTRCHRTKDSCTSAGDSARREGAQVSFCESQPVAYCSATFTNEGDAAWSCTKELAECSRQLGGMAGVPGTKQSECAAVH